MDSLHESANSSRLDRKKSQQLVDKLSKSKIFKDYEDAFNNATGLPLALRPIETFQKIMKGKNNENKFCALLGKTNKGCSACFSMQAQLEKESSLAPKSLKCFAGMCDTSVPIRVGDKLVAFLNTGQVLMHKPNELEFTKTVQEIIKYGSEVDLKSLEEAYFQTKVLNEEQYQAFISLLNQFSEHLALLSNSILLEDEEKELPVISKAKRFIKENLEEGLTLQDVASSINCSASYFCKMFKETTGMTFLDYLSRLRIEKAKNMLNNPHKRITEIAYDVGFQSISQFNRSFSKIVGTSPSKYRQSLGS